jgi:predicted nucleic acid-binding protein
MRAMLDTNVVLDPLLKPSAVGNEGANDGNETAHHG